MDHIFISHAHEDEVVARKICAVIEEWGRATWVSFRDITPGAFFNEAVKAALTKSYCVVVICSSASVCNRWVNGEVERALNRNKTVIPVVIEECEIPIGWSMLQRLRWNEADAEKFKASLFRALPDTALLRLSQLLNENGHLSKVKEIIKEHPEWLPIEHFVRSDYRFEFDAEIKGKYLVDVFAARMDSAGPLAYMYYLLDYENRPFLGDGELCDDLRRTQCMLRWHVINLRKPLSKRHPLYPKNFLRHVAKSMEIRHPCRHISLGDHHHSVWEEIIL